MDELALRTETDDLVQRAEQIGITSNDDYVDACNLLLGVKAVKKKFSLWWEPIRLNAQDTLDRGRAIIKACAKAEEIIKIKISAWKQAQTAREEKLQAAMQEAGNKRLEEIKKEEAAIAMKLGEPKLAEEILQATVIQRLISAPVLTPDVDGISYRDHWEGRVDDEILVTQFALANPEFRHFLVLDHGAINAAIRKTEGKIIIPGVTVLHDKRPAGRIG